MSSKPQNNTKSIKKIQIVIFAIALFSIIGNCFSQTITWERSYLYSNWTSSYSVKQTSDGNYIICGLRVSHGGFVAKLNQLGDTLWVRYFPVAEFTSIIETNDGNYLAVGWTYNVFIVKINNIGNVIWTQQIIEPDYDTRAYHVCKTNDGKYAFVGEAINYNATNINGYFVKFDENGTKIWAKFFDFKNTHIVLSHLKQLNNNDFILSGGNNFQNNGQFFLVRTNSNGDTLWTNKYGTGFYEYCYSVFQTYDKGFLAIGRILYFNGQTRLYLTKTDSTGNLIWSKIYGDTLRIYYLRSTDCAVKVNYNNTYVITGLFSTGLSTADTVKCFLLSIDSLGNKLWEKFYYKDTVDISGSSVDICRDSGYIITGDLLDPPVTQNLTSPQYLYVIKTNKKGEINPIGINNNQLEFPVKFKLYPAYPNPFNPYTTILFDVPINSFVTIKLFNILGQEIKEVLNKLYQPGKYEINIDINNLSSGIYIIKFTANTGFNQTQKIVLIK